MKKEEFFSYKGKDYVVQITYKYARCIYARFGKENIVKVTAPYRTSKSKIFDLVTRLLEKYSKKISKSFQIKLVDENYIYLLGKKYTLIKSNKTKLTDSFFYFRDKNSIKKYLKKFAYNVFLKLTRNYEEKMNIKKPYKIQIRFMKSKHGVNRIKENEKRITYSGYLIHLDLDVIEFIVVHELCHEFHRDHKKGFYFLLNSILPDAKIRN